MVYSSLRRHGASLLALLLVIGLCIPAFPQYAEAQELYAATKSSALSVEKDATSAGKSTKPIKYSGVGIARRAKVQGAGKWSSWTTGTTIGSTSGKGLRAMKLKLTGLQGVSGHIRYKTYRRGSGWKNVAVDGKSTGSVRNVESVKIRLTGKVSRQYDVLYRVYMSGSGWRPWVKNGASAGLVKKNQRVKAVQIKLAPKTEEAFGKSTKKIGVLYEARYKAKGWQAWKRDGKTAGHAERNLRGFAVKADAGLGTGGVSYRAYSKGEGWTEWKADGAYAGVKSKKLQAMKVKLTGKIAKTHDVYYRSYVQGFGWLEWAKNGATSGGTGYDLRLEAFQMKLVPKGGEAPGETHYPTVNLMERSKSMNGIDIASYQAGIDIYKVQADFVIVKATEGTTYTNPYFKTWAKQVLDSGKQLGIYHFATDGASAKEQADFFYKTVKPYVGRAVLFLDWENTDYSDVMSLGPSFAKKWLDRVYKRTGVKPLIYINQSTTWNYDWSSVARKYKLWLAQYLYANENSVGYLDDLYHWDINHWESETIYQYSSTGMIDGYDGRLDLDKFHGSVLTWKQLAKKS